ncbi:tRNA(Ile)-lysidine synthase [uncultured Roseburia sp.]|uniref:tRNA(Ile)-lysidine synthase n=1 Tax=Brotonthovivens ammoniilytica TaxID=2981725 RepID=A0ABT2TMS2_9FIRM|nr:tRNA lysidine(34) synthetase TilS [Brotonthovivens ammoniilytica]MCU6762917.1 tRNA lysidine(34) synthetase TilS [Brotonthovivens ammoniilytica]SCI93777.1 tRNA(Ile)-lysidine synthase [uncultured Roseburia sp.]
MINKILEFQEKYHMIQEGDKIVAGFSGGADSVCLLLVLKLLRECLDFEFMAVHVEHGIRGEESQKDAKSAQKFCQQNEIKIEVFHVDVPAKAAAAGMGLEEMARQLRYQCFYDACERFGGNKIAVAHHSDDCAETMLFQLSRGSGIRGLTGIMPVRDNIIRPLLCVSRKEILEFLKERGQEYCTDSTNDQDVYARNRIRKYVIPQLLQINNQAVEHMQRTAKLAAEVCDFLDTAAWDAGSEGVIISYDKADTERIRELRMRKDVLARMHPVLQKNFLYQLLGRLAGSRKDIGSVHVTALFELFGQQAGKELNLPYSLKAVCEYDYVWIFNQELYRRENAPDEIVLAPPGVWDLKDGRKLEARVFDFDGDCKKIPEKRYTKWFDYDKINSNVLLRKRRTGDYFITDSSGNHKKLKAFFIQEKVPRLQRDLVWLLADGSHILWIVGYRISEAYKVTQETKRILEVYVSGGNEK